MLEDKDPCNLILTSIGLISRLGTIQLFDAQDSTKDAHKTAQKTAQKTHKRHTKDTQKTAQKTAQ